MPIMNWWNYQSIYLGQIAPTVWHNATTILAMPAVIALFYAGLKCLDDPRSRNVGLTAGLCLLAAAIKPNYVLAWLPVFAPWFCINAYARRVPLQRLAAQAAMLVAPTAVLLLAQGLAVASYLDSKVIVAPFGVWALYSPHPMASLLLSVAFPLAVLALYRKPILRGAGPLLAWLVFAVAMLQLIFLAEDGARFSHGNFFWGAYMALYMLFLTSADVVIRQPATWRSTIVLSILTLHVASGAYFYGRIVSGLGYF
jgi:hypothetical protein